MCAKVCKIVLFHVSLPLNMPIFQKKIGKTNPPPAKFEPLYISLAAQCSTTTPPSLHTS